jgi:YD repeat-containing protein
MNINSLFTILSILIFFSSYSQEPQGDHYNQDYLEFINKTINKPTSFDFYNYSTKGEVDKLTGKFGLNVPFHTIKTPYIDIPISLQYSTSGLKLNQMSNEVGMDWNLIAGGQITTVINDFSDVTRADHGDDFLFKSNLLDYSKDFQPTYLHPLLNGGGHYKSRDKPGQSSGVNRFCTWLTKNFPLVPSSSNDGISLDQASYRSEVNALAEIHCSGLARGYDLDTELDYYMVSVGDLKFSFVVKMNDEIPLNSWFSSTNMNNPFINTSKYIQAVPLDDISVKITPKTATILIYDRDKYDNKGREVYDEVITGFEIIDKSGIQYYFNNYEFFDYDFIREVEINFPVAVNGKRTLQYKQYNSQISSYKLTKIILPNKDEIQFNYLNNTYLFQKEIPRQHDGEYKGYEHNLSPKKLSYGLTRLDNRVEGYALSNITYKNQKVNFKYNNYRPDLYQGGLNLEKIELTDQNNSIIKQFDLVKQYEDSDELDNHLDYRIFLKEIIDSQEENSYKFEYYSGGLPARERVIFQDIFGYYMGNIGRVLNPDNPFPSVYINMNDDTGNKISYEDTKTNTDFKISNADRSVKLNYPASGAMYKVIFPTKGSLEIEYENNTYNDDYLTNTSSLGPGARTKKLNYYNSENTIELSKSYEYQLFSENTKSSGKLMYKPSFAYFTDWAFDNNFNKEHYQYISFPDIGNTGIGYYRDLILFANYNTFLQLQGSISNEEIHKKLIRFSTHSLGNTSDIYGREIIYTNVLEKMNSINLGITANGSTKYYYKYSDNRAIVNSVTGPSDRPSELTPGVFYNTVLGDRRLWHYQTGYRVDSGLIERKGKDIFPFPSRNYFSDYDALTFGKLEKTETYDNNDKLVSSSEINYQIIHNPKSQIINNIKTDYLKIHQYKMSDPYKNFYHETGISNYNIFGNWYYSDHSYNGLYTFSLNQLTLNSKAVSKSVTTRKYFDNAKYIEEKNNYSFSDSNGNLITEEKTDSNQNTLLTMYHYPYPTSNPDLDELIGMYNKNIIKEPYLIEKRKNNILVESILKKYKSGSSDTQFNLNKVKYLKGEGNINTNGIDIVEFTKYDEKGNLLEGVKKDGLPFVYIYGYSKTLVIAKIENSNYATISALLAASGLSIETINESHQAQLNELRTSLPNAMITTYTHKPLVGVSTITDPRGITVYYDYDEQNRLKSVKDHNGNLVSEHEYKYKN